MIAMVGEKIRDHLSGEVFEVKRTLRQWVLPEGEADRQQHMTGRNGLKIHYERVAPSITAARVHR